VRFLVDNQLPRSLALHLRQGGHEAVHVLDLNLDAASDICIWEYAAAHAQAIVTKDEDFSDLVLVRPESVVVVWIRLGNCRTRELLAAFDAAIPDILDRAGSGRTLIELY